MLRRLKKPQLPIRDPDRADRIKRTIAIVAVIVAFCGGLGFFWFLTLLGPREVDYTREMEIGEISDEVRELREQSIEYEARFEEILALRAPTTEDLEMLREAVILQQRYIDALPGFDSVANERIRGLTGRYHEFAAQPLYERSIEFERQAGELERADRFEEARQAYNEAFRLQKVINEDYPASTAFNLGRATRLQRQGRHLSAEPLLRKSRELEAAAAEKAEARDWEAAESLLRQSIAVQEQINREYRGSNQASVVRREGLELKLVGIRSGQEYLRIERLIDLAARSQGEGEYLEAASLYQEARRLQEALNRKYPDSPHASAEAVATLRRNSETAQSYELGMAIERGHEELVQLLAARRTFDATERIVALRDQIQRLAEAYPNSALNDRPLELKIRYLSLIQGDIGFIQERIDGALLPLPGYEGARMLRTEVAQALYELIMGANPSRNRGATKPVETVSWAEAQEFCERLSWILGAPVRLPTENEFRAAIGRLRYVKLEAHVWGADASDEATQPVGTKEPLESGYYDLLGNVSEWLQSVDAAEGDPARHIGGHAQDSLEVIFTVPVRNMARTSRSRLTGFRIVVETER